MENKHVQTTELLNVVPLVFHGLKVQKATGTPCTVKENFSAVQTDPKNKLPHPLLSPLMLNSAGHIYCHHPATLFDCLQCETNGNHFTNKCHNLQLSKEQCKANCTQSRPALARESHSKPSLQMLHLQTLLVKQVASCPLQTLSLINTGTQTQGSCAVTWKDKIDGVSPSFGVVITVTCVLAPPHYFLYFPSFLCAL